MRVLLTNDDGIGSAGLRALIDAFGEAGHDVWAVAPDGERSGSASSLGTITDGVLVAAEPLDPAWGGRVRRLAVHAPPALGVCAVCAGAFGWLPDIVVSGINHGFNTGRMVLHSGTVGAVLTAASRDIPGIAMSTANAAPTALATAASVALGLAETVGRDPDAGPVALNVNVPGVQLDRLGGIGLAGLSETSVADVSFEAEEAGIRVRRIRNTGPFAPGTDAALLQDGWVSITELRPPWASGLPTPGLLSRLTDWWPAESARTQTSVGS